MNNAAPTELTRRELAHRTGGGLETTLYWHPHDNSISIEVHDTATEETISFPVPADRALDAFYHPFAHLAEPNFALTAFDWFDAFDEAPMLDEGGA